MNKLLISEPPLLVLPSLAKLIGLNEAIFIQQIHYWSLYSKHIVDGDRWLYNSHQEWQEQFPFWSIRTIRRIIENLERQNLLISGNFNKLKIDRTKWYKINYEKLNQLSINQKTNSIQPSWQNGQTMWPIWTDGQANLDRPLPKTTTKNTTNNNTHKNSIQYPIKEPTNPDCVCVSSFAPPDVSYKGDISLPDTTPHVFDNHSESHDKFNRLPVNENIYPQGCLIDRLKEWFTGKTVERLKEEYPIEYLEEKINLTLQACPRNPPAFLTKALKEDWKESESLEMDDVLLDAYTEIAKDRAREAAMEERRQKMLAIMPDWEKKWLEDFEQKHGRIEL